MLIKGFYHKDEGHKDENWVLKFQRQILQENSEKTSDPLADAYQRHRNDHHNGAWDGLEQTVRGRSQMIVSVRTNLPIIVEERKNNGKV